MTYWLMKSEPDVFSIDDLYRLPNHTDAWEGVRNYQARNLIRDKMQIGDLAFFYHSSCQQPGIVGTMEIVSLPYPDETAFDPNSNYYDPKSNPEKPRWYQIDVRFKEKWSRIIPLTELRTLPALKDMWALRRFNRLSITPVTPIEWETILTAI